MFQIGNSGVYINPAHVSLLGGVRKIPNRNPGIVVPIILLGSHMHEAVFATEADAIAMRQALLEAIANLPRA